MANSSIACPAVDPAERETVEAALPPDAVTLSQRDLYDRWKQGEVGDQEIIAAQGSGVWHHFLTRREHEKEQQRRLDQEHQEWLNREFSSDASS